MLEKGVLARCDRCGKRVFFPLTKQGNTAEDWKHIEAKILCPECAEEFERIFTEFLESEEQQSDILYDGDEPVKPITTIDDAVLLVDDLEQTMVYASERILDPLHGISREES